MHHPSSPPAPPLASGPPPPASSPPLLPANPIPAGRDHEALLQTFLAGLRRDPAWTAAEVAEVESNVRRLLTRKANPRPATLPFRIRPDLRIYG